MTPFDWHRPWVPKWTPWEVAFRATFIYFFAQLLFRVVGRKELMLATPVAPVDAEGCRSRTSQKSRTDRPRRSRPMVPVVHNARDES